MIIEAKVGTPALKPSATRKKDLRDFVGTLKLQATNQSDMLLLRELYNQCFGRMEKKGSIKVFDSEGKEVLHYGYEPKQEPVSA